MTKVVIVSGIQIINNPRVVKEATALSQAGFEVEVIGAIFDKKSSISIQRILQSVHWKHIPVIDLTDGRIKSRFDFFIARMRRSFYFSLISKFGIESKNQLGYYVSRLYQIAKSRKADLYIVHLEQALWVGKKLLEQGCNVAIDVEDWYSEDGLPKDRALRPLKLIKQCEHLILNNAIYSISTSKSLSEALSIEYRSNPPTVIYNSFPEHKTVLKKHEYLDRKSLEHPSIIWFSQTVGPGRGLEQLFDALNQVTFPFELHIRGTARPGYRELLLSNISRDMAKKVYFHPQVPQDELRARLSEHDIGYCGELSDCKNHDLTISNKMMEYLCSGLAVIASNTKGQAEVADKIQEGVFLFDQNSIQSLLNTLNTLLKDNILLDKAKNMSECGFKEHFSWADAETKIVELANMATNRQH